MKLNDLTKKLITAAGLVASCLLFTACSDGSNIKTNMQINTDGSGVREMTIVLVDDVFEKNFNGTVEDLKNVIDENLPEVLTYEQSTFINDAEEEFDSFVFKLEYDSVDDYVSSIATLTELPVENFEIYDSVFKKGYNIREQFTSEDLFDWLSNAIVEEGYVKEDNAERIFGISNPIISFKNDEYTTSSYAINANKMTEYSVSGINIANELTEEGSYTAYIDFPISNSYVNENGDEFESYFNSILPTNASLEIVDGDYVTDYLISAKNIKTSDFNNFYSSILGGSTAVNVSNEGGEDFFDVVDIIDYSIDLESEFISQFSSGSINYIVNVADYIYANVNEIDYGYYPNSNVFGETYLQYFNSSFNSSYDYEEPLTINAKIKQTLSLDEIFVELINNDNDTLTRNVKFKFDGKPSDSALSIIGNKLLAFASESDAETKADTSIAEGMLVVTELECTLDELNDLDSSIYGKSSTSLDVKGGFVSIFKTTQLHDTITFSNFLNDEDETKINYSYPIIGVNMKETSPSKAEYSGEVFTATTNGQKMKVEFTASEFNLIGTIIIGVAVIVLLAIIAVVLVIVLVNVKKKKKANIAAQASVDTAAPTPVAEVPVVETPIVEAPIVEAPVVEVPVAEPADVVAPSNEAQVLADAPKPAFCTNCGEPLTEGTKFCTKCGTPIE